MCSQLLSLNSRTETFPSAAALQEVNRVLSEDVAAFHKQVSEARIDLLPAEPPIELPKAP